MIGKGDRILSVPRRVFLSLCAVLVVLSVSVASLAFVVFVQNDDIQTGVDASCANSRGLVELVSDPRVLVLNESVLDELESAVRACPE